MFDNFIRQFNNFVSNLFVVLNFKRLTSLYNFNKNINLTDQKRINIDSIGKVVLRKSSRAKYLAIRIKPNEGVIVTIPKRASYKEGEFL